MKVLMVVVYPESSRADFLRLQQHNNGVCQITEHLDLEGDSVCARNTGTLTVDEGELLLRFTADF